ncbi:UDP-glucosyltransferase, putative [Ricinus communis]|uniref:UDP-glucosyltransferase, putative n=1 Tax=Ricinus communis TaxID=3988 RepID=B9T2C2_RICCO|nr:UDP-glucosyltransferase, putative [Ricinus communis]
MAYILNATRFSPQKKRKEQQDLIMGEPKKLHVALFPWLAFGHIIPYLDLAQLIAQKGHKISFISTSRNIQRLPQVSSKLSSSIKLISLTLPQVENLPHDAESTMDLPYDHVPYLKKAYDLLQDQLLHFLQTSAPDWIIYDFSPHWLPPIAANLGISGAFFSIFGAWSLTFLGSSSSAMINGDDPRTKAEHLTVPPDWVPFSSKVAFRLHEAKRALDHLGMNNSGQLHGKPVLPVGILPPSALDSSDDKDDTWIEISSWLDKHNKGSVVYIAFGSESAPSQEELEELALGLELSGLPFFWTLRKRNNDDSIKLPDGFEERVKGRGLVWMSWAPQVKILAHESVGGFLTHCGYSSIIEALHFGRALIMFPLSLDQGLIARVFEEKKVGVEIKRDEENGWFTKDSVAESLKLVMVKTEGNVYRDKAKEMKKVFGNKELHDRYMGHFVEFLQNHCRNP